MSHTYATKPGKRYQVVLRKKDARHGIVDKQFFETPEAADQFIEENEHKYAWEFTDLAYFKAI